MQYESQLHNPEPGGNYAIIESEWPICKSFVRGHLTITVIIIGGCIGTLTQATNKPSIQAVEAYTFNTDLLGCCWDG